MEFGKRTRDCSLGHAVKDGPHLEMTGASLGFSELWRQCGFSYEVRRGAQGASRVAPRKSGLHAHGKV